MANKDNLQVFNYKCEFYSKDDYTHLGMHEVTKGYTKVTLTNSQEGVSLATEFKNFNPHWPKCFGLRQLIQEFLPSTWTP